MIPTSLSLLDQLRDPTDHEAWERLVTLYSPFLRYWLTRGGCPVPDTDDLLQEVLIRMVQQLPRFEHKRNGSFRKWLRVLANRQVVDYLRAKNRTHAMSIDLEQVISRFEDPKSDLGRKWDEEHNRYVVSRLLEMIRPDFEPKTWEAFYSLVICGDRGVDVAAKLGMTPDAVYTAKSRVLQRMEVLGRGLLD